MKAVWLRHFRQRTLGIEIVVYVKEHRSKNLLPALFILYLQKDLVSIRFVDTVNFVEMSFLWTY